MSAGKVVRGQQGAIAPAASDGPVGQASLPDQVVPEPGSIRSERPGPAPAPGGRISETYLAARGPDVIDVNERKWSAKKAALREGALAEAAKAPKADRSAPLFGTPLEPPAEGDGGEAAEADAAGGEAAAEGEAPTAEEQKAAELQEIAKRDRENRRLRKELKALERKGASVEKKEAWLRTEFKKNPRGVVAFLGGTDQEILQAIRDKGETPPEVPKWEEPAAEPENTELEQERSKRRHLEMQVAERNTSDTIQRMVAADGSSRWPAAAAMGQDAINEAMRRSMDIAKTMKRAPTKKEALGVLELCLDEVNEKYAGIAKRLGGGAKAKGKPQPRNPVTVPRQNPMDKSPFRDDSDPRNRPTWRELGEQSRRKYFGR